MQGETVAVRNVLEIFEERGFLEQVTDYQQVKELLESPTTCYIGFDPTAKSLHVGSLLPIMSLVHMQRNGHRPIVVIGGGTALVGDPSGKTEMRPVMTREEIDENAKGIKKQMARFLDFEGGKALMVNNADWLTKLNYIEFLRDIGRHFSVNRMLAAESYKARLETGLSFIEFNYMLLQAYDFWYLFKHYDCRIQMGGNDQWGNILAGADLIRRLEGEIVHGITFPLLTTSSGIKMGKTHKGAIWLDPDLTSPYEYYQYWINQDDRDVERFLALFTLLPMEEVRRLGSLQAEEIREAKRVLAFEATKLCHGEEAARQAQETSEQLFGRGMTGDTPSIPSCMIREEELEAGIPAYILFERSGLCKSRGEARRLITQGGGYVNGRRVESFDEVITLDLFDEGALLLRAGKKRYAKVQLVR
ncbi:MAG: tyrosine--tRNA ligase [Deltaproteobacteria bacterium]|nr:MAG: tyrosine--tRNA ligase [Deltaproteobacteria bacterium]RLB85437.1 MAG: tyrosine--tRNA ligase [Deltaproteobacteria bacterium]